VAETFYRRAQPYHSRLPVICAGNLTVGGTGKTPFALTLCERLKAQGERPVALSRGYGGALTGPHWVSTSDSARDVGDEPLLLARVAPTLIARDRKAGALAIEASSQPASVIVMDDGLQNPQLAKDLALAVVDARRGIGNGLVIPAGPLRAGLGFQLKLVDAILINEGPLAEDRDSPVIDWLRANFAGPVLSVSIVPADATPFLHEMRVVAWAGIAAPERFFAMLTALGAHVVESVPFPDHYALRETDAGRLLDLADRHGAHLITTEKDLARLQGESGALKELAAAARTLPIKLQFSESDEQSLATLICAALSARRA
jgi:tetraacyldisaccharide 4'-kinase